MQNVLITGGSEGIGLGLATRFLARGSKVLVTGRSRTKLDAAAAAHAGLLTFVSDMGIASDREALAAHVRDTLPALDVVINNAGIQRRVELARDDAPWAERQAEMDILLAGPVHLNHIFVPLLLAHARPSAIVNVTSGGAFIPQPFAPMYSACKAALHSYTMNLRLALADTPCRVVEIIPPAVRTSLAGGGHGAPLDDFCDAAIAALVAGETDEIGFGPTAAAPFEEQRRAARAQFDASSTRFPVQRYQKPT